MRAQQFIKDHGLEKARKILANEAASKWSHITKCGRFFFNEADSHGEVIREHGENPVALSDLKRLVKSVDIVNNLNGINEVKKIYETRPFDLAYSDLKQAIADYESIYGEEGASHE